MLIQLVQIFVAVGDEEPDDFGLIELIIGGDALGDQHDEIDLDDVDLIHVLSLGDLYHLRLPLVRLIAHHEGHPLSHHRREVALVNLDEEHVLYLLAIADLLHQRGDLTQATQRLPLLTAVPQLPRLGNSGEGHLAVYSLAFIEDEYLVLIGQLCGVQEGIDRFVNGGVQVMLQSLQVHL